MSSDNVGPVLAWLADCLPTVNPRHLRDWEMTPENVAVLTSIAELVRGNAAQFQILALAPQPLPPSSAGPTWRCPDWRIIPDVVMLTVCYSCVMGTGRCPGNGVSACC